MRKEIVLLCGEHEQRCQRARGLFWAYPQAQHEVRDDEKQEPHKIAWDNLPLGKGLLAEIMAKENPAMLVDLPPVEGKLLHRKLGHGGDERDWTSEGTTNTTTSTAEKIRKFSDPNGRDIGNATSDSEGYSASHPG